MTLKKNVGNLKTNAANVIANMPSTNFNSTTVSPLAFASTNVSINNVPANKNVGINNKRELLKSQQRQKMI